MDEDVVERARRGDQHAFAVLATSSIDRLYAVAYRVLRDSELARDATQQALFEAWRDLPSLRDAGRWEAWSYRLVVHACYALRRSERRYSTAVRSIGLAPSAHQPDASLSVAERDQLERAFRRLPAEQRAVVVLHYYAGLRLTEIAESLGIPDGTARSRLHHALRRLRTAIEAEAERGAITGGSR